MATANTKEASGRYGNIKAEHNTGVRIPDAIKKLRGTYRKDNADAAARRQGAEDASQMMPEIEVPEVMIECPDTLTNPIARSEWEMFIKPLIAVNVIKLTDVRVAEVYCDLWAAYQDHKTKYGYPPVKIAEPMIRIMTQMGLTPVSRHKVVRMMANKGKIEKDDWSSILNHDDA
jgi:phage terminase small subunit